MSVSADFSDLRRLATDLTAAGALAASEVRPIVSRGALNIKRTLVADLEASRHFAGTAPSVSYDTTVTPTGVEAEIGPDKDRRGALANVAYFGTSRGGGTVRDPQHALDAEAPAVERYLGELVERALR